MSASRADFSGRSPDTAADRDHPGFSLLGGAVPASRGGLAACRPPKEGPTLKFIVFLQNLLSQPLRQDDRGATAVEYGLMVALIAVVIIGAVTLLGNNLSALFNTIAGAI